MPEELFTPKKSLKQLEKENKRSLKKNRERWRIKDERFIKNKLF